MLFSTFPFALDCIYEVCVHVFSLSAKLEGSKVRARGSIRSHRERPSNKCVKQFVFALKMYFRNSEILV